MKWKLPPKIKVYEALGAICDDRVKILDEHRAEVLSSDRAKTYQIQFDLNENNIIANDNGSYWQGYLGYPAVAALCMLGRIHYRADVAAALKGIQWKKVNTQFHDNYDQTVIYAQQWAEKNGIKTEILEEEVRNILITIEKLHIHWTGKKLFPAQ